jgi:transposase
MLTSPCDTFIGSEPALSRRPAPVSALEANAALRSIVRRDTGEDYQKFLVRLTKESGIRTPTREQLARLDRKRARKVSNQD